jgi:hypothetical protein
MATLRRRTRERGDSDAVALDRAVALLRGYQRAGATEVPVADVLEMLGASPEAAPATEVPVRDPAADPLTHCMPVTPRP